MSKPKPTEASKVTDEIFNETVKSDRKKSRRLTKVRQSVCSRASAGMDKWKPEDNDTKTPSKPGTSQGQSRLHPTGLSRNYSPGSSRRVPTYPRLRKKLHPLQKLLGETAVRFNGETEDLKAVASDCSDGVIAVYISAHWCPPCRKFTPMLMMAYEHVKRQNKKLEVVFVSCDIEESAFREYFMRMPWLAVPWDEEKLEAVRRDLGISGIPALLFLEAATGAVWARNGVEIVRADPRGELFPWRDFPKARLRTAGFAGIPDLEKKLQATEEAGRPETVQPDDKRLSTADFSKFDLTGIDSDHSGSGSDVDINAGKVDKAANPVEI